MKQVFASALFAQLLKALHCKWTGVKAVADIEETTLNKSINATVVSL